MTRILIGGVVILAAYFAVAFNDGITLRKEKPTTTAQATPANWPCPLPAAEGERSVVTLEKRGGVYDVTCRDIVRLIRPFAPKGAK